MSATTERIAAADGRPPVDLDRAVPGGAWALDGADRVGALWGAADEVLWAPGEPLMLAARTGVGKTTVLEQLALRRSGVRGGDLLGYPVEVGAGRVLYVAADRPAQGRRSLRRMVREADREALNRALLVWPGPLPFDLGRCRPGDLAEFVALFPDVDAAFLDSLGTVAVKLSEDEVGSRVAGETATLLAAGVELAVAHHQRKGDAHSPDHVRTIEDVYGSAWLTAAMGSVLHLDGAPGDLVVTLRHLKSPAAEVGPLTLRHDHERGETRPDEPPDLVAAAADGITARGAAALIFGVAEPDKNQREKARRRLEREVSRGTLIRDREEGGEPTTWRAAG